MNVNKKTILVYLILGLVFSSIIRIKFNFNNGFEFRELWITFPLPLFDMASDIVKNLVLTSTIIGYLFYVGFGITLISDFKSSIIKETSTFVFLLILFVSISMELVLLIHGMISYTIDYHVRVGPTLFLIGLYIYFKRFVFKSKTKTKIIGASHYLI